MSKENRIWVFRLSEDEPGNPKASCPVDLDIKSIKKYIDTTEPLDDDDSTTMDMDFLKNELFKSGKLRQGWGYEYDGLNLDLRQPEKKWLENYRKLSYRLWGEEVNCEKATGRRNILKLMLKMKVGDIVLIPKIPDDCQFTVAKVKKEYYFHTPPDKCIRGHVIEVEDTKAFDYGNETEHVKCRSLAAQTFMPYRRAVNEIRYYHKVFPCVDSFLRIKNIIP